MGIGGLSLLIKEAQPKGWTSSNQEYADTTVCTKDGRKRNGSLLYTIRPIEEAKENYFEQRLQRAEEVARQKAWKLFEQHRQEQTRKVV